MRKAVTYRFILSPCHPAPHGWGASCLWVSVASCLFDTQHTEEKVPRGPAPSLLSKYKAENLQTWWCCVGVAKGILPRLLRSQQRTDSPGLLENLEGGQVGRGCFVHKQTSWRRSGRCTCKLCCPCLAGWLWALWYEVRQGWVEEGAVSWSTRLHPSSPGSPGRGLTWSTSKSPRETWLEIPLPKGCPLGCFQATVTHCLQEVQLEWLDSELTFSPWAVASKGNRWDRQKAFP